MTQQAKSKLKNRMLASFPTLHITKTHPRYRIANVTPQATPNHLILMRTMSATTFPGVVVTITITTVAAHHQKMHPKTENEKKE